MDYDAGSNTTTVADHRQFNSFGKVVSETDPGVKFLYGYTGGIYDADINAIWLGRRLYDVIAQRFLERRFESEDGVNWYAYVGNNPTNMVNAIGLEGIGSSGWNPWNWGPSQLVRVGYDMYYGNYSRELELRAKEAELDARLQSRDDANLDGLRAGVRRRNQKPIPDSYNNLIQEAETGVAGSYGGLLAAPARVSNGFPQPLLNQVVIDQGSAEKRPDKGEYELPNETQQGDSFLKRKVPSQTSALAL